MYSDDPDAYNDYDHPDAIAPATVSETVCKDGMVSAVLPPLSWNMLRFERKV